MTLLRCLTLLLKSQTVTLTLLLFWMYFLRLMLVFVLQWLSHHWEILIMLLSQFPLTFHQIYNRIPHFIGWLMTILVLIGMVFMIIWEMLHGRIYLNSVIVGIDVYISHQKYHVKPHSSPWFSAASVAAIVHRNHFFVCTNRINIQNLKESSDRPVIIAKGFLKLPNLLMLIKQKSPCSQQR